MRVQSFKPGDLVIYRKPKRSTHPGPRAADVHATPKGEEYLYVVDKFWVVIESRGQTVVVRTRRGKTHEVEARDPHLRRARWWEKLLYRHRFPRSTAGPVPPPADNGRGSKADEPRYSLPR
ncbi:MAG: hypothetical protein KY476_07510 [Planctomycetes bacterium]|nr:hypothetical protein [Planctomycetota bacterium]